MGLIFFKFLFGAFLAFNKCSKQTNNVIGRQSPSLCPSMPNEFPKMCPWRGLFEPSRENDSLFRNLYFRSLLIGLERMKIKLEVLAMTSPPPKHTGKKCLPSSEFWLYFQRFPRVYPVPLPSVQSNPAAESASPYEQTCWGNCKHMKSEWPRAPVLHNDTRTAPWTGNNVVKQTTQESMPC